MKNLLLIFFLFFSLSSFAQSPWAAEKGKGFAQVGTTLIGPYNALFIQGTTDDFTTTRELMDVTVQLYTEYGLGKGWEVSAIIPFAMQSSGMLSENPNLNPTIAEGNLNALGNIHLGLKKELYKESFILSAVLRAELNTAGFDESTGLRTGYDAFGLAPSIIIGKGAAKWYAYLNTGPTLRSNGYSSEWRVEAEAGYLIHPKVYAMFNVFVIESFQDGDVALPLTNLETGFYVNNQSFFAFGPKFLWSITDKFGLSAAAYGAFGGNQVAKAPSLNAGIFWKW